MFLKIILISLLLLGISVLGMMFNILFKKKGKFPQYQVGRNKDMHKLGISCVKHEEIRCHKEMFKEGTGCSGC